MRLSFRDCFIRDYYQRYNRKPTFREILKRFILYLPYNSVVRFRIAEYCLSKGRICQIVGKRILFKLSKRPGIEIHPKSEICSGISFPHPHDIVIGAGVKIGKNVTIYNGVNLGAKTKRNSDAHAKDRYPVVGDNVVLFSGAKIIGNITIGNNTIVGANSVVTKSFAANTVIAGIPAKEVK